MSLNYYFLVYPAMLGIKNRSQSRAYIHYCQAYVAAIVCIFYTRTSDQTYFSFYTLRHDGGVRVEARFLQCGVALLRKQINFKKNLFSNVRNC